MDRYAVIGYPVEHSLSPEIHAAFARQTGADIRYDKLAAPEDGFEDAASAFFRAGGLGLNVTLPFKEAAAAWVDDLDRTAHCGAVNTIALRAGRRVGYNTDGVGLVRDLRAHHCALAGRRILVLGAGGAVRGILGALMEAGADSIALVNRSRARAEALAGEHDTRVRVLPAPAMADVHGFDLVINGTSAGLDPAAESWAALLDSALLQAVTCYDLSYNRQGRTAFCEWAGRLGAARVIDGLGMLVEQAAAAFAIWRGVAPDARRVLTQCRTRSPAS